MRIVTIDKDRSNAPRPACRSPRIGFLQGRLAIPDDFDTMGESEIERLFGQEPTGNCDEEPPCGRFSEPS